MTIIANLIEAIGFVLHTALRIYFYIVIASALITWVNPDPYNSIVRFLRATTEPVFNWVRRYMPFMYLSGFDLSPIIVLLSLKFVDIAIIDSIFDIASSLAR